MLFDHGSRWLAAAATALMLAAGAHAQTPPSEYQDRIDPTAERGDAPDLAPPPSLPAASAEIEPETVPMIPIREIRFLGVDAPADVANAARRFIGRTASRDVFQEIVAAMSAAYERSAIALYTIVVPEQDFSDGVVRILIAEGHIEAVILTGETDGHSLRLVKAYADRLTAEKPTRRATLERYISLINDIPGLKTKTRLQNGVGKGGVRLILELDHQRPTVSAGFSNRTSKLVKDGQFSAEAKAYRLLRDGDDTRLNFSASVNLKHNLYAGLSHSTPILRDGARLHVSVAWLQSQPAETPVSGDAQIYTAALSYPIIRSYRRNLSATASFDVLNSDNAAFGSLIATERTRAARIAMRYAYATRKQSASVTAGASKGFDVLGANVTEPLGVRDFTKVSADASYKRQIAERFWLRLKAAGQWTKDALPANERFSVGGQNFGRGFDKSAVNADRGYALLIEPAWRPLASGRFAQSEVYAFADYAETEIFARGASPGGKFDLGSYGAGVRAVYKDNVMIELEAARPYDTPTPAFERDWRFFVRWRVKFRP